MTDPDNIDVDDYAGQVVLYLLAQHCKNSTVKKPDLMKAVLPEMGRKNVKAIIDEAKKTLKKVHGADLVELDENIRQFMLVNAVTTDPPLPWSDDIKKHQAVLLPILSFIFMNGGAATENEIMNLLRKLRIVNEVTDESEEFGDVEKLLKTTFVTQRYLIYDTAKPKTKAEGDAATTVLKWGKRAELEVSKEKVLQFVSEVYGVDITNWPDQLASINK